MANITVPKQCAVCNENLHQGEAIIVGRCELSNKDAYGSYFNKKKYLRVNFKSNLKRVAVHLACVPVNAIALVEV